MNKYVVELTRKYVSTLNKYFEDFSDKKFLAMVMNALLATRRFKDIQALMEVKGVQLLNRTKSVRKKATEKLWRVKLCSDID